MVFVLDDCSLAVADVQNQELSIYDNMEGRSGNDDFHTLLLSFITDYIDEYGKSLYEANSDWTIHLQGCFKDRASHCGINMLRSLDLLTLNKSLMLHELTADVTPEDLGTFYMV